MRSERCISLVAVCLGILAALVVAVITPGQARAASPSAAPIRRVGSPSPLARGPNTSQGTSVTAANWAGYDVVGGSLSSVTATWTQPAAQSTSPPDSDTAFWAGLDGDGSQTVEQIGTESFMADGGIHYDAWYEMYPAAAVSITSLTISPGDEMTATVISNGEGGFSLKLVDDTTQRSFTTAKSNGVTAPESAEVVAEAPTDARTGDLLALTKLAPSPPRADVVANVAPSSAAMSMRFQSRALIGCPSMAQLVKSTVPSCTAPPTTPTTSNRPGVAR